jgi:copper transport protein
MGSYDKLRGEQIEDMWRVCGENKFKKNSFFNHMYGAYTRLHLRHTCRKLYVIKAVQTCILILLCSFLFPVHTSAHAILTNANPGYNSQLEHSPTEIALSFNERLQKDLFRLEVFDAKGNPICCEKPLLSSDQRQIKLKLPVLQQGHYTVTYVVISTDGHPIQESYVFTVGTVVAQHPDNTLPGSSLHSAHSASGPLGFWAYRIFYYFSLLLLSGWVIWRWWIPLEHEASSSYKRIGLYLQFSHLITLIGLIIYQFSSYLLGWTFLELINLLSHTYTGYSWIISITLTVIGLLLLQRWFWFDLIWVGLLLFGKSINGHAAGSNLAWATVALDFIHLLAAALWVSGLVYLLIYKNNGQFYPTFSKTAIYSIVLLVLTGSLYTILILPSLSYLLYTTWGILLLCKIGLVFLVIVTGAILRKKLEEQDQPDLRRWLKFDMTWMIAIVIIAAIFSYLNPIPANEPLAWKEQQGPLQVITEISPMQPGINRFTVHLSAPVKDRLPKQVELWLTSSQTGKLAPIRVPLKLEKTMPGEMTYSAEGPYIPFPSVWKAEIKLMDTEDYETTYTKKFRLLP